MDHVAPSINQLQRFYSLEFGEELVSRVANTPLDQLVVLAMDLAQPQTTPLGAATDHFALESSLVGRNHHLDSSSQLRTSVALCDAIAVEDPIRHWAYKDSGASDGYLSTRSRTNLVNILRSLLPIVELIGLGVIRFVSCDSSEHYVHIPSATGGRDFETLEQVLFDDVVARAAIRAWDCPIWLQDANEWHDGCPRLLCVFSTSRTPRNVPQAQSMK